MKNIFLTAASLLLLLNHSMAQLTTAPDGGNRKAMVSENIGITQVTIEYSRPAVRGREGKIWGDLVYKGFADPGFGTSKQAPWRAGANENTVIEFTTPVMIEGKPVPAGKYGLFLAYDPNLSTLILSKNHTSWGSFFYDEREDALRVNLKPVALDKSVEWLKYEFMDQTDSSATVALMWEKVKFPFKISTDHINLQLESFRRELRSEKSFNPGWQTWNQAAVYCLVNNVNLEEALVWSEKSISEPFIGNKNFTTMSTKAQLLAKLNRAAEADALMKEALPLGSVPQIHGYARQLLQQKKTKEAFEAFKLNYDKNPNIFTTNMGLARGYSALGNYKKALEYAQKALPQADRLNKANVERMVKMLEEGKDVN
jgi:hypothetical protein